MKHDAAKYPDLWPTWFLPPPPGFDRAAEAIELGAPMHRATAVAFYGRRVVDACQPGEDGRYLERDLLDAILRGITWTPDQHHTPGAAHGPGVQVRPKRRRGTPVSGPTGAVHSSPVPDPLPISDRAS